MLSKRLQVAWDLLTEAGASFPDLETRLKACDVVAQALDDAERRGRSPGRVVRERMVEHA
jgi:hypothetical protein